MSRSRWVALLGPPLFIVLATGTATLVVDPVSRADAQALPVPGAVVACGPAGSANTSEAAVPPGAWWRSIPDLDEMGSLFGWTLTMGSPDGDVLEIALPPASIVSGPARGRVIVSADDEGRSAILMVDVAGACTRTFDLGSAIARHAIADPEGDGALVHLLARDSRADLGVWRVAADGSAPQLVLAPIAAEILRTAGIERVWATTLRASLDGRRLGVQSCDPEACATRIVNLESGAITTLDGEHGSLVGIAGSRVVTMAACHGLPCPVLVWNAQGRGHSNVEPAATGAAMSPDGRLVVAIRDADGGSTAYTIDLQNGRRSPAGALGAGALLRGGVAATSGLETAPNAVEISQAGEQPAALSLHPLSGPSAFQLQEAQP